MSIYIAQFHERETSNALMSLMSGKEMHFQVPLKTFTLDKWTKQWIRQWVPNHLAGDWESPGAKSAVTKPWNVQYATAGRTETFAAGNYGDWHAAVGEVLCSSVPKTPVNSGAQVGSAVAE